MMEDFDKQYQALWTELESLRGGKQRKATRARRHGPESVQLPSNEAPPRDILIQRMAEVCRAAFAVYRTTEDVYRAAMWERRALTHEKGSVWAIWDGRDELQSARGRERGVPAGFQRRAAS